MNKKRFLIILSILVSSFFLYLSFKDFKIKEIWEVLKKLQPQWIFGGIFLFLFSHFLRGIRWKLMLSSPHNLTFKTSQGALFISLFGNNIFPLKLGDIWRVFLVKKRDNISRISAGSSLILERIYDGLSILLIIWLSILFFHTSVPIIIKKIIFYFGIFILSSLSILTISFRLFSKKLQLIDSNSFLRKFFSGISLLNSSRANFSLIVFSFVIWSIETLSYGFFIKAFNFEISIPFLALIIFTVNIALLIPAAPGNLGTFEYSMILATSAFGITKNSGLSLALVIHFLRYISTNFVGLAFLSSWHINLSSAKELISNKSQPNFRK
jgi:hypothetical protein